MSMIKEKTMVNKFGIVTCNRGTNPGDCRKYAHGDCLNCSESDHHCKHEHQKHMGTSGNPYEGGTSYYRCTDCELVIGRSEDGTEYFPASYKPYYRTIMDDLKAAHVDPNDSLAIERFLGSNR